MKKIMVMILFFASLFPLLSGCFAENNPSVTELPELQYPDAFYWEREYCRFDINEVGGHKTPLWDKLLYKGQPVKTPQAGRLLAEQLLIDLQSMESYEEYVLCYVEYAKKDRVWLFCYDTKTSSIVLDASTLCYVLINSTDGSLIAILPSGLYKQREPEEPLPVQYAETRYRETKRCDYNLKAVEAKKDPHLEAFLSKGEPIDSHWKGKLLAEELLVKGLRTWSEKWQDYIPTSVDYATKGNEWIFKYSTSDWSGRLYIAINGADGSLITYWYEGVEPPEGLNWEPGDEAFIPDRLW